MMMNARCTKCREKLPEFNSRYPPDNIICAKCGTQTTGKNVMAIFENRMKQMFDEVKKL